MTQDGPLKGFRKLQSPGSAENQPNASQAAQTHQPLPPPVNEPELKVILCRNCGSQLFPEYRFCIRCGHPASATETAAIAPTLPGPLPAGSAPVQQSAASAVPSANPQPSISSSSHTTFEKPKLDQISWGNLGGSYGFSPPDSLRAATRDELNRWLNQMVKGNDQQASEAFLQIYQISSPEIVPYLGNVLNRRIKVKKEREEMVALLLITKGIESLQTLQQLLNLKLPEEHEWARMYAVGCAKHPAALPYLKKTISDSLNFFLRCMAIGALAESRLPEAVPILIQKAGDEITGYRDGYMDDDPNYLALSGNMLLSILGDVVVQEKRRKFNARLASWLTNPDLPLGVLAEPKIPGDARRMYTLHLRASALSVLGQTLGAEHLRQYLPHPRESTERTLLAMAIIECAPMETWIPQAIVESIKSNQNIERLLAYECAVRIMAKFNTMDMTNFVTQGLQDKDPLIPDAVAAAIFYHHVERLYPLAYNRLNSGKKETRISLLFPIAHLSRDGNAQAAACLDQLTHHDPDREIREMAKEILMNSQEP